MVPKRQRHAGCSGWIRWCYRRQLLDSPPPSSVRPWPTTTVGPMSKDDTSRIADKVIDKMTEWQEDGNDQSQIGQPDAGGDWKPIYAALTWRPHI